MLKKQKIFLADKARMVEQELLKENVGSQDHYACTFGGLNSIQFYKNHKVKVTPLNVKEENLITLKICRL